MAGRGGAVHRHAGHFAAEPGDLYLYGKPDWKPMLIGYLGLLLQGGCMLAIGTFISACTRNQIVAVRGRLRRSVCCCGCSTGFRRSDSTVVIRVVGYLSIAGALRFVFKRRARYQGHLLLT